MLSTKSGRFLFCSCLIQSKQGGKNVVVVHVRCSAVSGKDGRVEPGRPVIIELGQRAFMQLARVRLVFQHKSRIGAPKRAQISGGMPSHILKTFGAFQINFARDKKIRLFYT